MHSGKAAAIPPARNEATLSFCQASVRITTEIFVSNCMIAPARHSGMRRKTHTRNPGIIVSRFSGAQLRTIVHANACPGMTEKENHPLASQAHARITHSLPPNLYHSRVAAFSEPEIWGLTASPWA